MFDVLQNTSSIRVKFVLMFKYARKRVKRVKILKCQVLKHVGKVEELK
ncbi:hypothetical protein Hanom_Chr05g00412921 [Helianthus anomalus]